MRVMFNENKYNIVYKSDNNTKNMDKSVLTISACAMASPFLALIDGDSLKKTYKGKYIGRYATGLAAIGGGIAAANILANKYIVDKENESHKRLYKNVGIGASATLAFELVESWAQKTKKKFNKKMLVAAPFVGALIGAAIYMVNKNNYAKCD